MSGNVWHIAMLGKVWHIATLGNVCFSHYDEAFLFLRVWCWNRFVTVQKWVIFVTLRHREMFLSFQYCFMFVTLAHWVAYITLRRCVLFVPLEHLEMPNLVFKFFKKRSTLFFSKKNSVFGYQFIIKGVFV